MFRNTKPVVTTTIQSKPAIVNEKQLKVKKVRQWQWGFRIALLPVVIFGVWIFGFSNPILLLMHCLCWLGLVQLIGSITLTESKLAQCVKILGCALVMSVWILVLGETIRLAKNPPVVYQSKESQTTWR
ncbi:MAG: hypothetical protein KBD66_01705 [Candidatus Doudnabacteria bacterium]|nr:hypothetical protein [Candidatus Doudnabacteria bacterium]